MGASSRNKGAAGERELILEIEQWTGIRLERNLSQAFGGGHDLIGLDHWAIECKRYREITNADKADFWRQAVAQANKVRKVPAVCFELTGNPGASWFRTRPTFTDSKISNARRRFRSSFFVG